MGNDLKRLVFDNVEECMDACLADNRCKAFTFDRESFKCWLKSAAENLYEQNSNRLISGVRCNLENTPLLTPSGKYPGRGSLKYDYNIILQFFQTI